MLIPRADWLRRWARLLKNPAPANATTPTPASVAPTRSPDASAQAGQSEGRQAPRVPHAFLVRYRAPHEAAWTVSPLQDLSIGGARFLGEQYIPMGSPLELQLQLSTARQPVALKATVAWVKPGKLGMTELGVIFDADQPSAHHALEEAVVYFLSKQRPRP